MFRSNKLVVILPLILTVFMFASGIYYLNQTESITNEELSESISWLPHLTKEGEQSLLEAEWLWEASPDDGITGTDYIGVTFLDGNGDALAGSEINETAVTLRHSEETIFEGEGEIKEDGVLFVFPNQADDHETYGNDGRVEVVLNSSEAEEAVITYLHTWKEHEEINTEDLRFFDPGFEESDHMDDYYWVTEQLVQTGEAP